MKHNETQLPTTCSILPQLTQANRVGSHHRSAAWLPNGGEVALISCQDMKGETLLQGFLEELVHQLLPAD